MCCIINEMNNKMKVVIAGGKGFVGSNLCMLLSSLQYEIISLDIEDGFDLTLSSVCKQVEKFDVFVHLANLASVPISYESPELFYRVNYLTTLNALELCRKYDARFIYLSSYIYGCPKYLPVDEKHMLNPTNPYASTKIICESLIEGYNRDFGIESTILRPFNIYGKGQKGNMLLPEIFSQIEKGKTIIELRDPNPRRDYVHVVDVANAIKNVIDRHRCFCKYNICSGESFSVKEITDIIKESLSKHISFSFSVSDRPNEINETRGSYDLFNKDYDWHPSISFRDGIRSIFSDFK